MSIAPARNSASSMTRRWKSRDDSFADARQRITNDPPLRVELRLVRHVLQLAAAAVVDAIMVAERLDSRLGRNDDFLERSARESFSKL